MSRSLATNSTPTGLYKDSVSINVPYLLDVLVVSDLVHIRSLGCVLFIWEEEVYLIIHY